MASCQVVTGILRRSLYSEFQHYLPSSATLTFKRLYKRERDRKRFYKTVSISQSDGKFEINLDRRKLKTPMGNLFRVPSEPLALCVAAEWDSQKDHLRQSCMNFTNLCYTAIDDPMQRSKEEMADLIIKYLETDTICCRAEDPVELQALQSRAWDPIVSWVEKRHQVEIGWSCNLSGPTIPLITKEKVAKHLRSYNSWSLIGFQHLVEALKSVVLPLALVDRYIDVKTAVALSRLEEEFQIGQWGKVEWAHDVELEHLQSQIAASLLFFYFNTENGIVQQHARPNVP